MSGAPTSFSTVSDVINIQNNVLSVISNTLHAGVDKEGKTLLDRIRVKETQELYALKAQLEAKEKTFLAQSGLGSFEELWRKTRVWRSSNAKALLNDTTLIQNIQKIIENVSIVDLEEIVLQFQGIALTEDEMARIFGPEIDAFVSSAGAMITSGLKGGGSRAGTLYMSFQSNSQGDKKGYIKSEITKGITFFQRSKSTKSKKDNFEIHFTKNIPYSSQSSLKSKFSEILTKRGITPSGTTPQELHAKIANTISTRIMSYFPSGSYSRAKASIDKMVKQYLVNSYDIKVGRNSNVLRGALGEIYWNAFFDYIGLATIPVGLSAKTIGGKEIPVDILFKEFGFQVKNYKMNNGIVTFNQHFDKSVEEMKANEVSFHQFFSNAMQIGNADEIFGKFYFSKAYNIRNVKMDPKGKYIPIEQRFEAIEGGIHSYIKANQDRLLGLNKDVVLKTPELFNINFDPGKPILFLINDMPLLASSMVQEIINSLQDNFYNTVYINIKNLTIETPGLSIDAHWPEPVSADISSLAKNKETASVSYTIDLHVTGLINKILNGKS